MPSELLRTRLASFRKSRDWLREARDAEFKVGKPVRVRRDSGHDLYGLVVFDGQCPLTQLAVKLENGNSWWYEVEDCYSVRRDDCPAWLQRILKKDSTVSVRALTRHLKNEGAQ